jgi:periplasmic protein TonB
MNNWVIASAALHGTLALVVVFSPALFRMNGDASWGTNNGGGDGVNVKIVSSFSGIPLPAPPVVTENAAANESSGLYKTEPAPEPPEPVKNAIPIPDPKASLKKQPAKAPAATNKNATPEEAPPTNAVPYGQGGRPDLQYGQFPNSAGAVGAGFGDGAFGERYGAYVQAMTRQISNNWLKVVDSRLTAPPRVYLRFVIERDGTISSAEFEQRSDIPSLDNSAMRAIRASSPLPPLPPDYRGSNVSVRFYFEYKR